MWVDYSGTNARGIPVYSPSLTRALHPCLLQVSAPREPLHGAALKNEQTSFGLGSLHYKALAIPLGRRGQHRPQPRRKGGRMPISALLAVQPSHLLPPTSEGKFRWLLPRAPAAAGNRNTQPKGEGCTSHQLPATPSSSFRPPPPFPNPKKGAPPTPCPPGRRRAPPAPRGAPLDPAAPRGCCATTEPPRGAMPGVEARGGRGKAAGGVEGRTQPGEPGPLPAAAVLSS